MNDSPWYYVKKHTLLAVAGSVWLLAGFNVARLGVIAYGSLQTITVIQFLICAVVFCVFGMMFYKMAGKHSKRITGYEQEKKPVWHFFDRNSYCIMIVMMGGGILLRYSGLVPNSFIAVFYTGLGFALAVAGVVFWCIFLKTKSPETPESDQDTIS